MNIKLIFTFILFLAFNLRGLFLLGTPKVKNDKRFITYIVDTKKQDIKLYWKNDNNQIFKSILNLKDWLAHHNKKLLFAMNGGMYKTDNSPLGL